jgi:ESS family glutamate:Na+ symporter
MIPDSTALPITLSNIDRTLSLFLYSKVIKPFNYNMMILRYMYQLTLDIYQSAGLGAFALAVGMLILRHSRVLKRFCVPSAVVGGLLFSILALVLHKADVVEVVFDDTIKDICMRVFFCSIGFMASVSMIKKGERIILIMIALIAVLVVMQNIIGISVVSMFGLDPKYGLAVGSISLTGGHGTAAAYGSVLVEQYGLVGGDVIAVASATFGLAIASLVGAPLAKRTVERHGLSSSADSLFESCKEEKHILNESFLWALILIIISLGLGTLVNDFFSSIGITLPTYLGAMLVAIILRNVADLLGYEVPEREIDLLGWICLNLFLAMALVAMKLWQLEDLAAAMVVALVIQTAFLAFFAFVIVFRATGKNYESAALSTGVMGFGMGAIPNAIASMEALMDRFGPAPMAYFVVPIIGGVFLDLINVVVLTGFLNLL